ncbi:hypothetical protein TNCV_4192681 [Trichonephila clavipes]|nr:hypothetical protein TNCV_4192681 [Trichonephila clavipes]
MEEILQIFREEETTFNLSIKTRMDGINAEAFYSRRKNEKRVRLCYIRRKPNHQAKDCCYRNKNSLDNTSQRNITQETIRLEIDTYLQLPIEKKNFVTSCHILSYG